MVEHVTEFLHGAAAACPPFLHLFLRVGFHLVTDDVPVFLVCIGDFGIVTAYARLHFLVGGRGEYQPHRAEEYQYHCRQDYHFLPSQPFSRGQRSAFLLRLLLWGSRLALCLCLNLLLFHIYKVLC